MIAGEVPKGQLRVKAFTNWTCHVRYAPYAEGQRAVFFLQYPVEDGKIATANLGEYKLPNILDIPKLKTVLVRSPEGPGPYQAKGIGEMANVSPPAAIANAVADACGVRLFDLPVTSEKIYKGLKVKSHEA